MTGLTGGAWFNRNPAERRQWIVGLAVMTIASLLVVRLPLFNYLGYEFSAATAIVSVVVCGLLMIGSIRSRHQAPGQIPPGSFSRVVSDGLIRSATMLVPSILIAGGNAAFVRNCAIREGILFFLLLPVVSAFWTTGAAVFAGVFTRRPKTLFTGILILTGLYALIVGYTQPQIFSYNFIYGYFPGFSYDEILTISSTLVLFRAMTLLSGAGWFVLALLVIRRRAPRAGTDSSPDRETGTTGPLVVIICIAAVLATAWIFRARLGFETTGDAVGRVLTGRISTPHFTIYYTPGSVSDTEMRRIAAEHEFRFDQITAAFQTTPRGTIASYLYPDDDTKRRLLGTGTTNIAKPWLREIHITTASLQSTLKHELVHVIAGEFGMPLIKAHYRIGLVEGCAMAIDDRFGHHTLHEYSAALIRFGLVQNPGSLLGPLGFATGYSWTGYVMMGSFCRYLIDRYGIIRFRLLYGGHSMDYVYGKTGERLISEWMSFLSRIPVPDDWKEHVDFYFNRPSIFAKECARTVAYLNEEAYAEMDSLRPDAAVERFRSALATSWNSESFAGLVRSEFSAGHYDSVNSLMQSRIRELHGALWLKGLYLIDGDASWQMGDTARARRRYEEVQALDISDGYNEAVALRLSLLSEPRLAVAAAPCFGPVRKDTSASSAGKLLSSIDHPLLRYMAAREALSRKDAAAVLRLLEPVDAGKLPRPLARSVEEMRGQALLRTQQYEQAIIRFWTSMNYTGNASTRAETEDRIERCRWYEAHNNEYFR